MRYLVTGGAGFIGSHLADVLVAAGHDVVAFDCMITGRRSNIAHLDGHPRFRFAPGSVLDEFKIDKLIRECDVVVHLAAAVGVKLIVRHPLRTLTTNIRGSEIVLEAANRHRRKVLVTSSSEVYGKNSSGPLSEDADRILGSPAVARWAYSTSKAVEETLAHAYHKECGLPTIVARLFNVVGPRQTGTYGMVLPRFAQQAVRGEPVTVYGNGTQTRCFSHVTDVVYALYALLKDPRAEGDVFNVGAEQEVSILELATRVIQAADSSSRIRFIPYCDAYEVGFEEMPRRIPDISKIRELLAWEPRKCLDEVITEAVGEAAAAHSLARDGVSS